MHPRQFLLTATLALGCGSAQHAAGPSQEALVSSPFPPPHSRQKRPDKEGRCPFPETWPQELRTIARKGGSWVELDASEAQCREAAKENPYHVWAEGRCWFWLPGNGERKPTSSSFEPLFPVTTR